MKKKWSIVVFLFVICGITILGSQYINSYDINNRDLRPSKLDTNEDNPDEPDNPDNPKHQVESGEELLDNEIEEYTTDEEANLINNDTSKTDEILFDGYIAPNIVVSDSNNNMESSTIEYAEKENKTEFEDTTKVVDPAKVDTTSNNDKITKIEDVLDKDDTLIEKDILFESDKITNSNTVNKGDITLSDMKGDSKAETITAVEAALNINNPSIKLEAKSAILMDSETGKILFHKNATDRVYPASTTKLMTAIVALDLCSPEDEVTVGDEVNKMAIDSTRAYLKKGERLTIKMLLEGLLLPSGNDAAYVIATYVGRVSQNNMKLGIDEAIDEFLRLMNNKVEELNLIDTHFMTPCGYDAKGQYTTAYDMAVIAKEALEYELICSIAKKIRTRNVFLSGEDVTWNSSNKLIQNGSGVYYKYAIGLKTGTSSLAGRCLVSAAEKEDRKVISVVMNSTAQGRWEDSLSLLKYGIDK